MLKGISLASRPASDGGDGQALVALGGIGVDRQEAGKKLGCSSKTLHKWLQQHERDSGQRPGLTTDEKKKLKELERENRELKRANEILRKASAYFAHAQLERGRK